jgi:DNA replicative helicase MCM subunit Mcm2 (Cdc46/Mcm family)
MEVKEFVHARVTNPPSCSSVCKSNVSSLRSGDVGRLISVQGTVIRAGLIKMLESERFGRPLLPAIIAALSKDAYLMATRSLDIFFLFHRMYECAKCKHAFKVFADTSMQNSILIPPTSCRKLSTLIRMAITRNISGSGFRMILAVIWWARQPKTCSMFPKGSLCFKLVQLRRGRTPAKLLSSM